MGDLKPCPLCGGDACLAENTRDRSDHCVECLMCGLKLPGDLSKDRTVARWNRRAAVPSPPPPDWTATPPTGPGWYWAATEHGTRRIVNVVRNEGDEVVWRTTGYEGPLSEWALWWPVPLAPPPSPGRAGEGGEG